MSNPMQSTNDVSTVKQFVVAFHHEAGFILLPVFYAKEKQFHFQVCPIAFW
jgi:hypothetical protein